MSIKEQLNKQKELIFDDGDVGLCLYKVRSIFNKYYDEKEAKERYDLLFDRWSDNSGNYGFSDSRYKRDHIAGLLGIMIEEIPDNAINKSPKDNGNYIDEQIILDLEKLSEKSVYKIDYLVKICNEINSSYQNKNYFAVTILTRSIIDITPPIFGKNKFTEVVSNVSLESSHRKQLDTLQNSLRNYADGCLHIRLNKSHPYPTKANSNFKSEIGILLELIKEELTKNQ